MYSRKVEGEGFFMNMELKAEDICFKYNRGNCTVLQKVNFTVSEGESVALLGPSGCGKSTLAKVLAGYLTPQSGRLTINGQPMSKKGYNPVQLVYQHPEQAVNPRWKLNRTLKEGHDPAPEILRAMGIEEEWLFRWPMELSGGELQRFCIARVLGPRTRILICDEISTMLDPITQAQIWDLIVKETKRRNMGLIVVTHNMALADRVCNRKVFIEGKESSV